MSDHVIKRFGHGVFFVLAVLVCLVAESPWPFVAYFIGVVSGTWEFRFDLDPPEPPDPTRRAA